MADYLNRDVTSKLEKKIVDETFAARGFTRSGGMWGDAQWKQVSTSLIVSVGQAYSGDDDVRDADLEALQAPETFDPTRRCSVWSYRAPFLPHWTPDYGEPPIDDMNDDQFDNVVTRNVIEALAYIDALIAQEKART